MIKKRKKLSCYWRVGVVIWSRLELYFLWFLLACRAWSERGGSCSSGSRSPTATCRWRCWSARRRGSTSARRTTSAATIWRRCWRRPTAPIGFAFAKCCWGRHPPAFISCPSTRPTRGSSQPSFQLELISNWFIFHDAVAIHLSASWSFFNWVWNVGVELNGIVSVWFFCIFLISYFNFLLFTFYFLHQNEDNWDWAFIDGLNARSKFRSGVRNRREYWLATCNRIRKGSSGEKVSSTAIRSFVWPTESSSSAGRKPFPNGCKPISNNNNKKQW